MEYLEDKEYNLETAINRIDEAISLLSEYSECKAVVSDLEGEKCVLEEELETVRQKKEEVENIEQEMQQKYEREMNYQYERSVI